MISPPVESVNFGDEEQQMTRLLLRELLKEAAAAHGEFEVTELGGSFDPEWPAWFANHMTGALRARGYRLAKAQR